MRKTVFTFLLLQQIILSQELVVIANQGFARESLALEEIQAIFLDKKRFINNEKILVMNFEENNFLRSCFEENILKKTKRALQRYWQKAYYKGKRPPKIIKSKKMLFSYLMYTAPSIGYCDQNSTLDNNVTVLYKITCK